MRTMMKSLGLLTRFFFSQHKISGCLMRINGFGSTWWFHSYNHSNYKFSALQLWYREMCAGDKLIIIRIGLLLFCSYLPLSILCVCSFFFFWFWYSKSDCVVDFSFCCHTMLIRSSHTSRLCHLLFFYITDISTYSLPIWWIFFFLCVIQ